MDAAATTTCFTPRSLAKFLRIRPATVFAWIESGRLEALNVGDARRPRYRIMPQAVEALAVKPTPSPVKRAAKPRPKGWVERY